MFIFKGTKKFLDGSGMIYTKMHESLRKILLSCNNDNCVVSAEINKATKQVKYFGIHHHDKPTQNDIRVEQLSAHLKRVALDSRDSGLVLFKKAVAGDFKGICLPTDFKHKTLEQIRNIRKYNKAKQKKNTEVNIHYYFNPLMHILMFPISFLKRCHRQVHCQMLQTRMRQTMTLVQPLMLPQINQM